MNDKVYANAPEMIQVLKDNIRVAIGQMGLQLCENVKTNSPKRVASVGGGAFARYCFPILIGNSALNIEIKDYYFFKKKMCVF